MLRHRPCRFALPLTLALVACAPRTHSAPATPPEPSLSVAEFSGLIQRLSEPGGYFPSENLVSNETSYLHVLDKLDMLRIRGGAYLGVGPDQNFSYIAAVHPEIAFLIDIRRDNLLQHLLFKAAFELSRNRLEYLCFMTARPVPEDILAADDADIAALLDYIEATPADPQLLDGNMARVRKAVARYGVTLDESDVENLERIQASFARFGLSTRYTNRGRYGNYPTWRHLILETDLSGTRRNYLASEASYQYLRSLQRRNLIVPVVGDLSGPHALAAIGNAIAERGLQITAFYTSNVEQYLMQGPAFAAFAQTVAGLPVAGNGVIIRSYFRGRHPQNVPGHTSTQLLEPFGAFTAELLAGGYTSYYDLVTKNVLSLRD